MGGIGKKKVKFRDKPSSEAGGSTDGTVQGSTSGTVPVKSVDDQQRRSAGSRTSCTGQAAQQGRRQKKKKTAEDKDYELICAAVKSSIREWMEQPLYLTLANIAAEATAKQQECALAIFKGKFGAIEVEYFFDPGAQGSFVSESLVRAHGIQVKDGDPVLVTGFEGTQHWCRRAVRNISVKIGEYSGSHTFVVAPLAGFQVILGMDWCRRHFEFVTFHNATQQLELVLWSGISAFLHPIHSPAQHFKALTAMQVQRMHQADEIDQIVQVAVRWISPDSKTPGVVAAAIVTDFLDGQEGAEKDAAMEELAKQLEQLQKKFADSVLSGVLDALPPDRDKDGGNFGINLKPGEGPSNQPPRRLGIHLQPEMERQLAELLARNFIRESTSEFGAPVLFVKKKGGTWRMCVDYRSLNDKTIKDKYPLPHIDALLDTLHGAKVFTSLDAVSGYHQCRVRAEDIHKTAFRTQYGHFEYLVLPFGLTNAPAHFQRYMNGMFRRAGLLGVTVLVYLDDILVFSRDPGKHAEHVEAVLQVLKDNGIVLNPEKCHFGVLEVEFLGHIASGEGIKPDPRKVAAIKEWKAPTNVTEVKSFVGAVNFHRRHIEHCASIAAPLNKLMRKDTPFEWRREQQEAFDALKNALISAPVLRSPVFGGHFYLYTDASGTGMGGALYQEFEDGNHPIAYWSRCYAPAEKNYMVTDQEMCAAIFAVKAFEHYLKNATVTVLTDHSALTTFLTKKDIKETSRHLRWAEYLAEFDIKFKHVPGKSNVVADALSRKEWKGMEVKVMVLVIDTATPSTAGATAENTNNTDFRAVLEAACASDTALQAKIAACAAGELPKSKKKKKLYQVHGSLLYKKCGSIFCLEVPTSMVPAVLREMHDSPSAGHMGVERTEVNIRRHYYWETLTADVAQHVASCPHCQRIKPVNQTTFGTMKPLPIPTRPWQVVNMDFFGPFTPQSRNGFNYAMSVTDRFTKMVHIMPCMKQCNAVESAELFISNIFRFHGMPEGIVSDRDPRFTSEFWKELMKTLDTSLLMSTAMHPQTDGLAERQHRTIEETLSNWTAENPSSWVKFLPLVEFAMNNAKQGASQHSPFFLNFGQHPRTPAALVAEALMPATLSPVTDDYLQQMKTAWKCAHKCIESAQNKMKERADRHRQPSPFKVGDPVLVSTYVLPIPGVTDKKLQHRYNGPWEVKALRGENAVALELKPGKPWKTFNVSHLKYYNDPGPERDYARPGPDLINDEEFWPIVSFARNRWKRCKQAEGGYKEQFFVRWKDYPDSDNTWLDVGPLEAGMEAAGFAELLATLSTRVPMPTPAPQQSTIKKKSAAAAGPARVTRSKK